MKQNNQRRQLLKGIGLSAAAVALHAPPLLKTINAKGLAPVTMQTGWLAQAEQGGFYQALAQGFYKEHGLDVKILPGGPQMNVMQLFMAGMCDFADVDSFRAFSFAQENLPAIAVAAFFQKDPRIMMSHPGTGNDSLEALKDKPLMIATGGRQSYWLWLKAKYGLSDAQLRPYTFSLAPWIVDRSVTVQGLITSEPFNARKAGIEPVIHLLADHGFANYSCVIAANPKMVRKDPEIVRLFVQATSKGWSSYLHEDPTAANALIQQSNPQMSTETISYASSALKQYHIVETSDTKTSGIGSMSEARWKEFYDAMVAAGSQKPGLDLSKVFTTQFVQQL